MNQDLNEALLIAEGKTMMLPERRHLIALVEELKRFDKYVGDMKTLILTDSCYRQFA